MTMTGGICENRGMAEGRFSRRTDWDTAETEWARLLRERRAAGLPILDLTASNPTRCGFEYDAEAILGALQSPAALDYDPESQRAVAGEGSGGRLLCRARGCRRPGTYLSDHQHQRGLQLSFFGCFAIRATRC